jgi:hypothetical protein
MVGSIPHQCPIDIYCSFPFPEECRSHLNIKTCSIFYFLASGTDDACDDGFSVCYLDALR